MEETDELCEKGIFPDLVGRNRAFPPFQFVFGPHEWGVRCSSRVKFGSPPRHSLSSHLASRPPKRWYPGIRDMSGHHWRPRQGPSSALKATSNPSNARVVATWVRGERPSGAQRRISIWDPGPILLWRPAMISTSTVSSLKRWASRHGSERRGWGVCRSIV